MRKYLFLFALYATVSLFAQEIPKNVSEKIRRLHQTYFKNNASPGIATLVLQDNQILFQEGFGFAQIEKKILVTPKTLFYIASISKMFTAMAIMILEEEGKLAYNDPLSKFFPEFPAYAKKITIQHLLQHTAGLPDYIDLYEDNPLKDKNASIQKYCLQLLAQEKELLFSPGTQYEYSNSGYLVLACIAEKAADQFFPDIVQKKIMKPLGMKSSDVLSEKTLPFFSLATPYEKEDGKFYPTNFGKNPLDLIYGDGGVITNLEDMAKWHLAWTSEILVSKATLKKALTPTTLKKAKISNYGFGVDLDQKEFGTLVLGHDGSWDGWNASFCHCPKNKITLVVLSNQDPFDAGNLSIEIMNLFLSNEEDNEEED